MKYISHLKQKQWMHASPAQPGRPRKSFFIGKKSPCRILRPSLLNIRDAPRSMCCTPGSFLHWEATPERKNLLGGRLVVVAAWTQEVASSSTWQHRCGESPGWGQEEVQSRGNPFPLEKVPEATPTFLPFLHWSHYNGLASSGRNPSPK